MDKVLVLSTDTLFNNKVKRIINLNLVFNDCDMNLNVISRFLNQEKPQLLIVHHSVKCHNLSKLFDYLVTNKIIPVIYINNTVTFSQFYQVINDSYFLNLEENKMDVTLPVVIQILINLRQQITILNKQINKLETKLSGELLVYKAKMILMEDNKLSENEAHNHLIKEAMDKRVSKEQIAKEILEKLKK